MNVQLVNVMDGLDIYIDDYTKPDPIAAEVIKQLAQFRSLGNLLYGLFSLFANIKTPFLFPRCYHGRPECPAPKPP